MCVHTRLLIGLFPLSQHHPAQFCPLLHGTGVLDALVPGVFALQPGSPDFRCWLCLVRMYAPAKCVMPALLCKGPLALVEASNWRSIHGRSKVGVPLSL